jgi:hypothetical protein
LPFGHERLLQASVWLVRWLVKSRFMSRGAAIDWQGPVWHPQFCVTTLGDSGPPKRSSTSAGAGSAGDCRPRPINDVLRQLARGSQAPGAQNVFRSSRPAASARGNPWVLDSACEEVAPHCRGLLRMGPGPYLTPSSEGDTSLKRCR